MVFPLIDFFTKKGLIAELPEMMTLTFCLGFSNQKDFAALFQKLWEELLIQVKKNSFMVKAIKPPFKLVQSPEIKIGDAWRSNTNSIPLSASLGKISGDIICPYPPGIPLIVPGERIDQERIDWIETQSLYNQDLLNSYISVLNN